LGQAEEAPDLLVDGITEKITSLLSECPASDAIKWTIFTTALWGEHGPEVILFHWHELLTHYCSLFNIKYCIRLEEASR
jgi:hypothetical protein